MKLFEIGEILKSHGLKGRMKVKSYVEMSKNLSSIPEVVIVTEKNESKRFEVRKITFHRTFFFLELESINTVDAADGFVGSRVLIQEDKLEGLSVDEYYWRDLIGLNVITEEGRFLGIIENIFQTGSNDVYVCGRGERELLLPAIQDVILKVDLEKKEMVVRLLDGL
jgi:16S rRNA processing protein RimM